MKCHALQDPEYVPNPILLGRSATIFLIGVGSSCTICTAAYLCNKGSLQAAVIIIPALNSLSTLLVVSCILWKTCRRRSRLTCPSPPSP